ncbi:MAG: hypothetical protein C4334_07690 [Pyrinomonas sp.]
MPITILIADDYDDTRELLRVILESNGYQVREAQNGRDCLELARRESPSLILLDISMPSLDGWSVLRERARRRAAHAASPALLSPPSPWSTTDKEPWLLASTTTLPNPFVPKNCLKRSDVRSTASSAMEFCHER